MVKLNFNLYGYIFQDGVAVLRQSFLTGMTALAGEVERAKDEAVGYQDSLDHGGEWIGERDDEGHPLWDQTDLLDIRIETAEHASMALRKAFVISAYHHWERAALVWTETDHQNHKKFVAAMQAKGLLIDPRLDKVHALANALKHASATCGAKLLAQWAEVFGTDFQHHPSRSYWYEAIHLTDAHVLEVLDVVSASGPTIHDV